MSEGTPASSGASFRLKAIFAFAAVYLIWGSTYLAIRFAIDTLPGFTMSGVRFIFAGIILLTWSLLRGAAMPTWAQWRSAAIMGFLLLLCGNGSVVWAEHRVPSGLAALLIGTEPLFIGLVLWGWPGGQRPRGRTSLALAIGFAGTAILAFGAGDPLQGTLHLPSVLAILFACTTWAVGSVFGREANLPAAPSVSSGAQMLLGGVFLLSFGILLGEPSRVDFDAFSTKSLLALAYLTVFGSLIAFSAYGWLIRNVKPTLVATYAYVNPLVAMFLGALLANEPFGVSTLIATGLILLAVVLVSTDRGPTLHRKKQSREGDVEDSSAPTASLRKCA